MKSSEVNLINKKLKIYGSNEYSNPIFRVVFSDDQTEKRFGTYHDYHGKIYVRTVREIREVKKYPWIKGKWILERWASGELAFHPSLENDKNGAYICVYTFQDINGNYLPPLYKVCEVIIQHLLHPRDKSKALAEDKEIEDKQEKLEVDKIENELKIESDESKTKDKKSSRESMSVGYSKTIIDGSKK